MKEKSEKRMVIIDPATRVAEIESFNQIVSWLDRPCEYHLPALQGQNSLSLCDWSEVSGVIIFGSGTDVGHEVSAPDWQKEVVKAILHAMDRNVPLLGICYGHQLLAQMHSGEIGWASPDRSKFKGLRKTTIKSVGPFSQQTGHLVNSHNQVVCRAPECMQSLASSDQYQIEAMAHRAKPVFSFQGHLEATPAFLRNSSMANVGADDLEFGHQRLIEFLKFCRSK